MSKLTTSHAGTVPTSQQVAAGRRRATPWKRTILICSVLALLGAVALDRVLLKLEHAAGPPIILDSQPAREVNLSYDRVRFNNSAGPAGSISVGALAPDFRLPDFADGHEVHLASLRGGKPVVIVFGSFSCNLLIRDMPEVKRFYQAHQDQAQFMFVYINEAGHGRAELDPVLAALPQGPNHRVERVRQGCEYLSLPLPIVLDTVEETAQRAYDAWPRRLVVVDPDGRIVVDLSHGQGDQNWDFSKASAWLRRHSL